MSEQMEGRQMRNVEKVFDVVLPTVDAAPKRKHPSKYLLCISASHCAPAVGAFDNRFSTAAILRQFQFLPSYAQNRKTSCSTMRASCQILLPWTVRRCGRSTNSPPSTVRRLVPSVLPSAHSDIRSTPRDRTISPLAYLRDSFQDNLQRKGRVAYESY